MPLYIVIRFGVALLDEGFIGKMLGGGVDGVDIPETVMTTRAPAVLKKSTKKIQTRTCKVIVHSTGDPPAAHF